MAFLLGSGKRVGYGNVMGTVGASAAGKSLAPRFDGIRDRSERSCDRLELVCDY